MHMLMHTCSHIPHYAVFVFAGIIFLLLLLLLLLLQASNQMRDSEVSFRPLKCHCPALVPPCSPPFSFSVPLGGTATGVCTAGNPCVLLFFFSRALPQIGDAFEVAPCCSGKAARRSRSAVHWADGYRAEEAEGQPSYRSQSRASFAPRMLPPFALVKEPKALFIVLGSVKPAHKDFF